MGFYIKTFLEKLYLDPHRSQWNCFHDISFEVNVIDSHDSFIFNHNMNCLDFFFLNELLRNQYVAWMMKYRNYLC